MSSESQPDESGLMRLFVRHERELRAYARTLLPTVRPVTAGAASPGAEGGPPSETRGPLAARTGAIGSGRRNRLRRYSRGPSPATVARCITRRSDGS